MKGDTMARTIIVGIVCFIIGWFAQRRYPPDVTPAPTPAVDAYGNAFYGDVGATYRCTYHAKGQMECQ
ncbi:MAG: hypothetical protein M3O61_12065 [Gemmatimonadota bacterium]|nr:hypothetical protein [Gemmatimonadota bacterium]